MQLVTAEVLEGSGKPDLMGALAQIVPSFTAQGFGGDMANQTLQAKLRGLSPNHVLILVDGKRRHTTANLSVLGGPFQGGAGVDLNFLPKDMIDHVEVLTDGAAAQYGTDAIAGVVNIITKKNASGGSVAATSGAYFDQGGQTLGTSGNIGFQPSRAPISTSRPRRARRMAPRAHPWAGICSPRRCPPSASRTRSTCRIIPSSTRSTAT